MDVFSFPVEKLYQQKDKQFVKDCLRGNLTSLEEIQKVERLCDLDRWNVDLQNYTLSSEGEILFVLTDDNFEAALLLEVIGLIQSNFELMKRLTKVE